MDELRALQRDIAEAERKGTGKEKGLKDYCSWFQGYSPGSLELPGIGINWDFPFL